MTQIQKIFLLEDEEVLGKIYSKKLKENGFDVKWAKTSNEADAILEDFIPDLSLLDHAISDYDKSGIDYIPLIRKKNSTGKICMLSNYSDFDMEEKALAAGACHYYVKIDTPPKVLIEKIIKMKEE